MFVRTAILVFLLQLAGFRAPSQETEIAKRLQHVFSPSGQGQVAVQRLANREFLLLEGMLHQLEFRDDSDKAEDVALQGSVAFLAGRMADAVERFTTADRLKPLNAPDEFTLAMALVKLEDDRAADVLKALSGQYPKQPLYLYWLGRLDYDKRLYPEALEKFKIAVNLDPQSARAWDGLGLTFDMQGETERAREAFSKAANLNRESPHPSAWPPHDLGYWHLRMDELREAESLLSEALRYDPKLAQAHYHLARTLEKEGRAKQAEAEYREAVEDDKSSPEACYSLGMLYRRQHRDGDADAMFMEYKRRVQSAKSVDRAH